MNKSHVSLHYFLCLGTILSGFMCAFCCCGITRHSPDFQGDSCDRRFCSFFLNLVVGICQLVTVLLCLVGWCWSIGWGVTLISVARK